MNSNTLYNINFVVQKFANSLMEINVFKLLHKLSFFIDHRWSISQEVTMCGDVTGAGEEERPAR
jgi:hypothetical protein